MQSFSATSQAFTFMVGIYLFEGDFHSSLLMNCMELEKDCSALDRVSSMLLHKAQEVGVTFAASRGLTVDKELQKWSEAITVV